MNQDIIKTINQVVYRRFPEVKGKKPKIQLLKLSGTRSAENEKKYLLVYGSQANLSDHQILSRLVRVVATEDGRIVKITTSKSAR